LKQIETANFTSRLTSLLARGKRPTYQRKILPPLAANWTGGKRRKACGSMVKTRVKSDSFGGPALSERAASTDDEVVNQHDDSQDQDQVNQSARDVKGKAQQP
jgi:hypothetical protein